MRRPGSSGAWIGGVLALAVLLLLWGPGSGPARAGVFDPVTFTLENGLQVVVIANHRAPIVTHMVWYRVGAADEPPGRSGIAHFLEHLMFKGTENFGPGEFDRILASNGGEQNAFTSHDYTAYFQNIAADRLETVMELEADRMTNLILSEEQVDPERLVILEERRSRIGNDPESILSEQASAALYQNHPYGTPVIGWAHEMEQLSRDYALEFYEIYYAPNNAILIVAGDVSVEEVRRLAEKYYGVIPPADTPPRLRPAEPPHMAARRVVLEDERVQQPSWWRDYLAPSHNTAGAEHVDALEVLSDILGGGTTTRLYTSLVVEQGVAAWAGAGYWPMAVDHTEFSVWASPRPGGSVEELEAAVDAELGRLLDEGVTQAEVEAAKTRLIAEAVYARDSLSSGPRVFGVALTIGLTIEVVETWPERIAAVTVEQVNAAARAVLREQQSVTAVLLPAE